MADLAPCLELAAFYQRKRDLFRCGGAHDCARSSRPPGMARYRMCHVAHYSTEELPMCEIEEKYADTIRSLIAHEDEVQNFRFTWFMGAEGFLFAVLGFAWDKGAALVILIALSGLLIALSAHVAGVLSDKAFIALDTWWKTNLSDYMGPPRKGFELRDAKWKWGGLMPHKFLPFVLGLGSIIVIIHRLYWK